MSTFTVLTEQSAPQPQLRSRPIPLYRGRRYFKCGRNLVDAKTGEKPQLNNLRLPWVLKFKFLERLIYRFKVEVALCAKLKGFIQRQSHQGSPASFLADARHRIADQNTPH